VDKLGFKGAMVHGLNQEGRFIDDKRYWPIFERARKLDVPIYLHPAVPSPAVVNAYYKDYIKDYPNIAPRHGATRWRPRRRHPPGALGVFDAYRG